MPVANVNHWQYGRWVYVIGRSLRNEGKITPAERAATETFIQQIGNPTTGTRKWLTDKLHIKAQWLKPHGTPPVATEPIDPKQNDAAEAKMIQVIGRDFKKTPLTTVEKGWADTFIAATGNRKYGAKGNTI